MGLRKTFFRAFAAAAALVLAFACTDTFEELLPSSRMEVVLPSDMTLLQADAYTPVTSADTRTALSGSDVLWSADDQIKVGFYNVGGLARTATLTASTITDNGSLATFTGRSFLPSETSRFIAVYPAFAVSNLTIGNTDLTVNFPTSQQALKNGFAPGSSVSTACSEASADRKPKFHFKNLGAILGFTITGGAETLRSVVLTPTGASAAGKVTFSIAEDGTPAISEVSQGSNISLIGSFENGAKYYFCVLPGTYSSLKLTFVHTDGRTVSASYKNRLTVDRCDNIDLGSFDIPWPSSQDTGVQDRTINSDIPQYDGSFATDLANDVIDYSNSDIYWEANTFSTEILVSYNGASATVTTTDSRLVSKVNGAHVVLDLETPAIKNAEITVEGSTTDGSLKIYSGNKYKLTLSGVDIKSRRGPAINSQCGKRVFVHLEKGTVNRFADSSSYSDDIWYAGVASSATEDRKACFFAEGSIIFSGNGAMVVDGLHNHAIASDDYIWVRPGVTVVVNSAAKNAIHSNGSVEENIGITIKGGRVYSNVGSAASKGVKSDLDVVITGGRHQFYSTGDGYYDEQELDTSSSAAVKSNANIIITGGTIDCKSTGLAGKGFNADGNIVIGNSDGTGPDIRIVTTGAAIGSSGGYTPGPGGGGGGGPRPGGQGSTNSSKTSKPKAIKADGTITVKGGKLVILTSQMEAEGIESKSRSSEAILISGGENYVETADDCFNAEGNIIFRGGRTYAWSKYCDCVDCNLSANGSFQMLGGILIAMTSAGGVEEGLDMEGRTPVISGGTLLSIGRNNNMGGNGLPSSTLSTTQPTAALRSMNLTKDNYLSLLDSSNKMIFSLRLPFTLSSDYSVLSCPQFVVGQTYTLKTGTSAPVRSNDVWNGLYIGGSVTATQTLKTIKFTSKVVTL